MTHSRMWQKRGGTAAAVSQRLPRLSTLQWHPLTWTSPALHLACFLERRIERSLTQVDAGIGTAGRVAAPPLRLHDPCSARVTLFAYLASLATPLCDLEGITHRASSQCLNPQRLPRDFGLEVLAGETWALVHSPFSVPSKFPHEISGLVESSLPGEADAQTEISQPSAFFLRRSRRASQRRRHLA